ncbi:MAG: hypothetical protein Q8S31_09945 [Alphaproteobacteria bacterium]|nr:hypothetical protein [Alphaproteobacteria bacterium]
MRRKISFSLKTFFKRTWSFLAGIDIMGDCLREVNATSPTGYTLFNRLTGGKSENIIWQSRCKKTIKRLSNQITYS